MRCTLCRLLIPPDGRATHTEDGHTLCESCQNTETWVCEGCGATYTLRTRREHICGNTYNGLCRNLCAACYQDATQRSQDSDDGYDDDDDDTDYEYDDPADINSYSYQPRPIFHGTGPLFLGPEIELATERDSKNRAARVANSYLDNLGYLKEDSSIGGGFEVVTHPMGYTWAMDQFPWDMLPALEEAGAYPSESCGMHVHVSRAGFAGPCHVHRWLKFVYRNVDPIQKLARRCSDEWAAFNPTARRQAISVAKNWTPGRRWSQHSVDRQQDALLADYDSGAIGVREYYRRHAAIEDQRLDGMRSTARWGTRIEAYPEYGRYVAVNTQNEKTFELRIFASSLSPQSVQSAFGFADASVEYAREMDAHAIIKTNGFAWSTFAGYVNDHRKYAPLSKEMVRLSCAS